MTVQPSVVYILLAAVVLLILVVAILLAKIRRPRSEESPTSLADIQQELQKLSSLFTIPHIRGGIGEILLEELLSTWLSESMYKTQYSFRDGARADAVIFLGDFCVAVDAKFPLESVRSQIESGETKNVLSAEAKKSLRKHMEAISTKYIRPEEGTLQFALMYIPSEKIYYHFFVDPKQNLYEEALRFGIVPVSPSNMFLYIQTVAYGLKGFSLTKGQKNQAKIIYQIQKDLSEFIKIHTILGTHVKNLVKSYEEGIRKLTKLEDSIAQVDNDNS